MAIEHLQTDNACQWMHANMLTWEVHPMARGTFEGIS